tara:strand:+ start:44 stop:1483 length:1440 start_codon:yes stop_codon:yes gene_type:complete
MININFKMLTKKQTLFAVFLLCIFTRLFSSIFYIEDIDSLRFALSIYEYDMTKLQPHFPGYPIFSFCIKIMYFFTGSLGISFSLIGGLSTYGIIHYALKIVDLKPNSHEGYFIILLILLNPLMWLMSNRYMPDMMGLAILTSSLYFLIDKKTHLYKTCIGFFLFGVLAGVRLSYLPLLFIPIVYHLIFKKEKFLLILIFLSGCLLWLIPMVFITGFNELWDIALIHTNGHFNDYGGTIYTEKNWSARFISFFRSIWADGLGGYWNHRSWMTGIISLYLLYYSKCVFSNFRKIFKEHKVILLSTIVYIAWVLLFQNVIHKSRHILPILVILILMFSLGQTFVQLEFRNIKKYIHISFFSFLLSVSFVLALQHKKPSAISQVKNYFIKKEAPVTIITIPLINYYLRAAGLKTNFINVEDQKEVEQFIELNLSKQYYMIGDFKNLFNHKYEINLDTTFYHNPYVNRMWSKLDIFSLERDFIE